MALGAFPTSAIQAIHSNMIKHLFDVQEKEY
jgi:hypothetical protein